MSAARAISRAKIDGEPEVLCLQDLHGIGRASRTGRTGDGEADEDGEPAGSPEQDLVPARPRVTRGGSAPAAPEQADDTAPAAAGEGAGVA